ncbi:MAG: aminotransferase class I/II-fold pyridoxal phosphate-dependent enzyme [Cyanobacteria bacterium NC_groundwater_1444_Ag_S-0.65um_54_12]|nr:aminotransferase class I/II-fold pyridoxal phosphate-dependent enzyme [Cyanobacteria bacterium NC_groundwater_1444_Ag_S-0.65um_54_12]
MSADNSDTNGNRMDAQRTKEALGIGVATHSLSDFIDTASNDLFDKCGKFASFLADARARGLYQAQYRLTITGPLDHRILVQDPFGSGLREMICFDSNSYLGLHIHPRVLAAVHRALDHAGYGTPSAQLLGGTSRYLRELEETVSNFYGRADTVIFPSGYAANVGSLTALLRPNDLVARDRFAHASIHDGCRWSGASWGRAYDHDDMADLAGLMAQQAPQAKGKLIVTDGIFSMHGRVCNLPELRAIADRYQSKLMIDEAHSLGVLGSSGHGLEEHFGLPGSIDVLMGTFSKAPGAVGGYVTGSTDLVDYLRFFARSCMFTAALPAATCAGLTEAFRIMQEEPEHREQLWVNAQRLWQGLHEVGWLVPPLESPIITAFVGADKLLWATSMELYEAGIKCGNVSFPAVPRGEAILRITANARHTPEEIDRTVAILERIGADYGILGCNAAEIQEIGAALPLSLLERGRDNRQSAAFSALTDTR